jgi:hypothetical protein
MRQSYDTNLKAFNSNSDSALVFFPFSSDRINLELGTLLAFGFMFMYVKAIEE